MSQETPQKSGPSTILLLSVLLALVAVVVVAAFAFATRSGSSGDASATPVSGVPAVVLGDAFSDGVNDIEPRDIPLVPLVGMDGDPFSLESLRGQWVVLYFGYTYCPDFCPSTLTDWRLIKRELGPDSEGLAFVMVSVDPTRDTPELLSRYVRRFDESFLAASGDPDNLKTLTESVGAFFESQDTGDDDYYAVDHTASTFLLDPQGRFVTVYAFGTAPSVIAADLRQKLAE